MSQSDEDQGWENYFTSLPPGTLTAIEAKAHKKRLASENQRIFSGQGEIETWQRDAEKIGI